MKRYVLIANSTGDSCVFLKDTSIMCIKNICVHKTTTKVTIFGCKLSIIKPFLSYPTDSSLISLYLVSFDENGEYLGYSAEDVVYKAVIIPFSENCYVLSIPFTPFTVVILNSV